MKCTSEGLDKCAEVLSRGGVVVFPTDTVYGIGCNPRIDSAAKRIFAIKRREPKKPLPVLAFSREKAEGLVELGMVGRTLASRYWPGQLTLVAPLADKTISSVVTCGAGALGVRVPANDCTLALLSRCGLLVGTSANLSGMASPRTADEVLSSGLAGFDLILDGGPTEKGRESTVVDLVAGKVTREGAISAGELEPFLEAARL